MISREPSHSSFAMADENDERSQSNTAMFTQVSVLLHALLPNRPPGMHLVNCLYHMSNAHSSLLWRTHTYPRPVQNPAAHVFRSMQKLAFGHISTDSLVRTLYSLSTASFFPACRSSSLLTNLLSFPLTTLRHPTLPCPPAPQADLDTGMSRSTSTGSVNSVGSMDNRLPPQEQGLAMAAAARNVFQAWEENISTNTGCKSMGNLQALDTAEGSPREAEGSAEASYFAVFFSTLDKFLSANAQVGELKDDAEASSPFPRVC